MIGIFVCVIVIVCCRCLVQSDLFVGFGGGVIGNFGKEGVVVVLLLRYFDEITKHWSDNTVRPLAVSFS